MRTEFETLIISSPQGWTFLFDIDDLVDAPCPVCVELMSEECWKRLGVNLQERAGELGGITSRDRVEEILSEEYERLLLGCGMAFYLEDMEEGEYEQFNSLQHDVKALKDLCKKIMDRIKNN